jgi:hypothetical protein
LFFSIFSAGKKFRNHNIGPWINAWSGLAGLASVRYRPSSDLFRSFLPDSPPEVSPAFSGSFSFEPELGPI